MANIVLGKTGVFILVMIEKPKRIGILFSFKDILKYQGNYNDNIKGWTIIFET